MSFECREAVDELLGFECAVSLSDRRLGEHACVDESRDRLVDGLHAPPDERGAALNRDDRRSGKRVEEQVDGRVLADAAEASSPIFLQFGDAMLERLGVGDGAPAGAGDRS